MNKTTPELHEMIYAEGDNWDNYPIGCKRGRLVVYDSTLVVVDPDVHASELVYVNQTRPIGWKVIEPAIFTQFRELLTELIPKHGY
jgi:hypothetical protein